MSVRVARLCALPIGVLAWRAPEPTLTVVVKATFLLGAGGQATLAAEQEPLWLDRPVAGGAFGDLDHACDFVPLKARVDVLLTGHARSEAAMRVLPAGFAVDKLRRRFYATTDEPAIATPLLAEYLRTGTGEVTRVGARAMWAGTLDGAAIVNDDGVPCAPIPRGFDYAAFNVAPPEQQLEMLSLTAQIVLDGLGPGGRVTTRLPGIRPRVFVLSGSGFGGARPPDEVVLRCDTIWIDADRSLCTLVWRGVVPASPGSRDAPRLVLALDEGDRKKTWARALTELDDATWTTATRPEDAREEPEIELDDDEIEAAPDEENDDEGPATGRMARVAAAAIDEPMARGDDDDATRTHVRLPNAPEIGIGIDDEPSTLRRSPAIEAPSDRAPLLVLGGPKGTLASFGAARPPGRPQRPTGLRFSRAEDVTGVALTMTTPALPVKALSTPSAVETTAPSFKAPVATNIQQIKALSFNVPCDSTALDTAPLPFSVPVATTTAPEVHWSLAKVAGRTVGESIAAADAAAALVNATLEPAVEAAPSALTMERYAEIKAEIWGGSSGAADVLERYELDEAVFHEHERTLAAALSREAASGQSTLALALRDALALARDQQPSTGERPLRTLEEAYVTLLTAIERAVDPSAILAAKGVSPASWRRLRRRFEARAAADAKLRDALAVRLATARKASSGDTGGSSKWWNRREAKPAQATRVPAKRRG